MTITSNANPLTFGNSKNALVLGSGGLRGSYQVGVVKALEELEINYDIVVGTSIGALNGGAIVQGYTSKELMDFWFNIKATDVYVPTSTGNQCADEVLEKLYAVESIGDLLLILRGFTKGSYDNTPYKNLVRKIIDADKIMASNKQFGLGTINLTLLLKYQELVKQQMKDKLTDYIIASSSAYPVFPSYKVGSYSYIDGGYKDALPIKFARRLGATKIIAVDINSIVTHEDERSSKDVVYLYGENLGSFLNFDQKVIQENIKKGYDDAIKALK